MELPEEVELRWLALLPWTDLVRAGLVCTRWHRLANDASLWEAAFVREFGPEAANAVRGATSMPQATTLTATGLERLWEGAPVELPMWFNRMTRQARPSRTEGKKYREDSDDECSSICVNEEPWDPAPQPADNNAVPHESKAPGHDGHDGHQQPKNWWRAVFLRHYVLRHRWLHGCDPQQPSAERPQPKVMRIVVCGMEASGKSSFLRALAPDQQVEDKGINVVVLRDVSEDDTVVLLEMQRPRGWHGQIFNGAGTVAGVMFVVDSSDFAPFLYGQTGDESAYQRMEAVYRCFHGITGEACSRRLNAVVCAHKIDLAASEADKEELRDTVDRKLRVPALETCTWYCRARASTVATSATADRATCLAALHAFKM